MKSEEERHRAYNECSEQRKFRESRMSKRENIEIQHIPASQFGSKRETEKFLTLPAYQTTKKFNGQLD
jgi:hypothetical protein